MFIITDCAPPVHRPPAPHRILYAGRDLSLPNRLKAALPDCHLIRSPDAATARLFLKSDIPYSAILIDAELPDSTGRELAHFAHTLEHRTRTPLHVIPPGEPNVRDIVNTFAGLLPTPAR